MKVKTNVKAGKLDHQPQPDSGSRLEDQEQLHVGLGRHSGARLATQSARQLKPITLTN